MKWALKHFFREEWALLLVVLLPLLAGFIVYPRMPEVVPIHWNASGQVDDTSGRVFGTFFLPLLNIGLYVLLLITPRLDPRRENYAGFAGTFRLIRWLLHIFMGLIAAITTAAALGCPADISFFVPVSVAVLFIILGAAMPRIKFNYLVGIRVPWTLADEEVWTRTHRVASRWMVAGGALALLSTVLFSGNLRFVFFLICILAPVFGATLYSYILFQQKRRRS